MQVKSKDFKIRASAAGKIMTGTVGLTEAQKDKLKGLNNRKADAIDGVNDCKPLTQKMEEERQKLIQIEANPVLPKTLTSYCDTWIKEQLYERRREFKSKYTDKGNIVEDNSLDMIGEKLGLILIKNEEFFEDDYKTGTPDALPPEFVVDAKSSWDCFTFPLLEDKVDPDYEAQAQVYMDLTGVHKYKLCYTLMNTPQHLIDREVFYYLKDNGYKTEDYDEFIDEFTERMTYDNTPLELRIKVYEIEYDAYYIKELHKRVELCREYISTVIEKLDL